MSTKFEQIKTAVERERQNKIKNEARLEALQEEEVRIKKEAEAVIGMPVDSSEAIEKEMKALQDEIENQINKVAETLESEGVEF